MQGALTEYSQKIIGSPISTEDGLYGIARNGTLFSNLEIKSQKEIQTKIDLTLKLKAISHILRIQVNECFSSNILLWFTTDFR